MGATHPKALMRRHFLAIPVILTVAAGCDNVTWGGIQVSLESPSTGVEAEAAPPPAAVAPPPELEGPVLMAGTREGSTVTLSPVGVVSPEGLTALPSDAAMGEGAAADVLVPDTEWILFAEGVRVGTMTAATRGSSSQICGPALTLEGPVELLPGATEAEHFLALPAEAAEDWPYDEYQPLEHTYQQRVASLRMAGEAVPRVGAVWPPEGVLATRRDVRAFRPEGSSAASVAVTFAFRDALDLSTPADGAYSLFLIVDETDSGFTETFTWYQPATAEGKAVPRLFSHLDWDRDGRGDVLLEVFGASQRWYAALERGASGTWEEALQPPCTGAATSAAP